MYRRGPLYGPLAGRLWCLVGYVDSGPDSDQGASCAATELSSSERGEMDTFVACRLTAVGDPHVLRFGESTPTL